MTIIQDGTETLTIETDDNVMQYVTTKVQGGTLSIAWRPPACGRSSPAV